jgi:hypothetical protein
MDMIPGVSEVDIAATKGSSQVRTRNVLGSPRRVVEPAQAAGPNQDHRGPQAPLTLFAVGDATAPVRGIVMEVPSHRNPVPPRGSLAEWTGKADASPAAISTPETVRGEIG